MDVEPSRQVEGGVDKFETRPGPVQGVTKLFEGCSGGEGGVGGV